MTFPEFIQARCGTEWGSQTALARRIGRSPGTVARWFDGISKPDLASCLAIAEELNLEPLEVMRSAGVPEKDIERFVRYCPVEKPDERTFYGRSHAQVHRRMQLVLEAFEQPVSDHIESLARAVEDLQARLEECVKASGAAGGQLLVDGKLALKTGDHSSQGWNEIAENRFTLRVRAPRNGMWEHFGGMYIKFAEMALRVNGLLR